MKKILIGFVAIVILIIGVAAVSSGDNSSSNTSYSAIEQSLSEGAVLLDVRTPQEFIGGYIEDAINFPLQDIQQDRFPAVAKNTEIYLYCRSGNRSAEAASILREAGFTNVVDLGGINDVTSIGGTVVAFEN